MSSEPHGAVSAQRDTETGEPGDGGVLSRAA